MKSYREVKKNYTKYSTLRNLEEKIWDVFELNRSLHWWVIEDFYKYKHWDEYTGKYLGAYREIQSIKDFLEKSYFIDDLQKWLKNFDFEAIRRLCVTEFHIKIFKVFVRYNNSQYLDDMENYIYVRTREENPKYFTLTCWFGYFILRDTDYKKLFSGFIWKWRHVYKLMHIYKKHCR